MNIHLLLVLMLVPSLVHAVGIESCHIEGKTNGKLIDIRYADDDGDWAYQNKKIGYYRYCKLILKEAESTPEFLTCAESKESKNPIIYELRTTYSNNGIVTDQFYICKTGCKPDVAKKLFYVCEGL